MNNLDKELKSIKKLKSIKNMNIDKRFIRFIDDIRSCMSFMAPYDKVSYRNSIIRELIEFDDLVIFSKVSINEWKRTCENRGGLEYPYENIQLPRRATFGSAGYDIFSNETVTIAPGESYRFSTGINVLMSKRYVLLIYPRSGLGFRYNIRLANTVGVIDSDYILSDNEGHIMIKLINNGIVPITIEAGSAIAQGIITPYITTLDDETNIVRNGGFGSTDVK